MKFTLLESMNYLKDSLSAAFEQQTDREFRAEATSTKDVSVFCISPYLETEDNNTWRYVVQILSKNNTITEQQHFDLAEKAVAAANEAVSTLLLIKE